MFHNRRRDGDIWQRAMDRDNATAWDAILAGAQGLADDPLPENDDLLCEDCFAAPEDDPLPDELGEDR